MNAWQTPSELRRRDELNPGESHAWAIGEVLPSVLARLGINGAEQQPNRADRRQGCSPVMRSDRRAG
jgi:hypothetical protein